MSRFSSRIDHFIANFFIICPIRYESRSYMTGSLFFAVMHDNQYVLTRSNVVTWLIVFNWLLNRKPLEDINFFREQCIPSTHDHPTLRLHELKDTDIPFGGNLS